MRPIINRFPQALQYSASAANFPGVNAADASGNLARALVRGNRHAQLYFYRWPARSRSVSRSWRPASRRAIIWSISFSKKIWENDGDFLVDHCQSTVPVLVLEDARS